MVPLAEFLELDADDREGKFPYIWTVDRKQRLSRLLVDQHDRRVVRGPARLLDDAARPRRRRQAGVTREEIEAEVRRDMAGKLGAALIAARRRRRRRTAARLRRPGGGRAGAAGGARRRPAAADYLAPWLDTEQCTACDECMQINPKIFAYNAAQEGVHQEPGAAGPTRTWSRRRRSARRG